MRSIAACISAEAIKKLAIPSNYRLGAVLAKEGKIEFLEFGTTDISARISGIKGSSKRTVDLKLIDSGLVYKCTCSKKTGWFCKHCVAVGLISLKKIAEEHR